MPFEISQLHPACGFDSNNGPRLWTYATPDVMGAAATVGSILETDVYFSTVEGADVLRQGDFIVCQTDVDTAPPNVAGIIAVEEIDGTTVTVSAADLQTS